MDGMIVKTLSDLVTGAKRRPPSKGRVYDWLLDMALVMQTPKGTELVPGAMNEIAVILRNEGAEPYLASTITSRDDRSVTRRYGAYEKIGGHVMAKDRILVRSIPGRPLRTSRGDVPLPPRCSIDMDIRDALDGLRHTCIMLVENRLCFDELEGLMFIPAVYDLEPLVLFKGSPHVSSAHGRYIREAAIDVHVFGDQDPAGLSMAITTPYAVSLVEPPLDMILAEIERAPNHELHLKQMATAEGILSHPPAWAAESVRRIVRTTSAIPQESFIRT